MDDESGESTEEDDVTDVGKGERDKFDGEKQEAGSRDEVKHVERNDQLFVTNEADVGGRACDSDKR